MDLNIPWVCSLMKSCHAGETSSICGVFALQVRMKYEFEALSEINALLVKTSGTYRTGEDTGFLEDMNKAYAASGSRTILLDCRLSNIHIDVVVALGRPEIYNSLVGTNRPRKVALVFNKMDDRYQYFRNVCQNRGWNVHVYDDYDTAYRWLHE